MRSTTWKSCLGALCLLAAGTASAAKISFSEKGFIDVGALVQAQYRIEQDAAATGNDPSHDFLLRRARILLSGQFNDNIGFIVSTEISYGAVPTGATAGTPSGAGTAGSSLVPGSTYVGGTGAGFNNIIYLNDALATYKFGKELILDAGLMLVPYSHNAETSSNKFATISIFPSFFAPNSQRNTRDVGVLIRGLLIDDRLYYRLGVFNGVQTTGTPTGTANINAGDAPLFAGMLRFNIAGKEDGYAFCQLCFAKSPIISVGVASQYQANAFRGTAPVGPTTTAGTAKGKWLVVSGDVFADIPFSESVELSAEVLFSKVYAGDKATVAGVEYASPLSGYGIFGEVALRFGSIAPFFQIEYFNSDTSYVGRTTVGATTTNFLTGDVTVYRFGLNFFPVPNNIYKISAEMSFQDRENAGKNDASVGGAPSGTGPSIVEGNHWLGTLQFAVNF